MVMKMKKKLMTQTTFRIRLFEGMGTRRWPISMNWKSALLFIMHNLGYKYGSIKEVQWVIGPNGKTCYRYVW